MCTTFKDHSVLFNSLGVSIMPKKKRFFFLSLLACFNCFDEQRFLDTTKLFRFMRPFSRYFSHFGGYLSPMIWIIMCATTHAAIF